MKDLEEIIDNHLYNAGVWDKMSNKEIKSMYLEILNWHNKELDKFKKPSKEVLKRLVRIVRRKEQEARQ